MNEQNWCFIDYKSDFIEFIREYGRLPFTDLKEPLETYKEYRKLLAQTGGKTNTQGSTGEKKLIEEKDKLIANHKKEI